MRRFLYILALVMTVCGYVANAQTPSLSCTQVLRTARTVYEQGRLHELPTLLEGCLKNGFTENEKVEAYKILVYTYIYLEEPQKADEAMIHLLQTDHFFEVNPAVDPVEFQNLYRKFRTKPIFSWGAKVGLNSSQVNVQKNYYIWADSKGQGKYKPTLGLQFGLIFEKNLNDKFILNPEIMFNSSAFNYTNTAISKLDDPEHSKATDQSQFDIKQNRIQLNILTQYKIGNSKFSPYVALGPSIGYLMVSNFGGSVIVGSQLTIPTIKATENYKSIIFGVTGAVGAKYKVGSIYITGDIRYQYGLMNIVNTSNRFKPSALNEELQNYGYIDNDISVRQAMFNVGLIIPYFNPKKLIK